MNKKTYYFLLITLFATLLVACKDDVAEKPLITGIEQEYALKQTAQLLIQPEVKNDQDATYEWSINNKVVSKEETLTFTSPEPGNFKGTFTVTNKGGSAQVAFSISVYGKYKYGTFILSEGNMGNETGTLSFIAPDGIPEDSIFIKANNGKKLGNVCQDMAIANGKVYIISQNGAKNGGAGKLIIADAETMKMEKAINDELNGWATNIAVPNSKFAYMVSITGTKGIVPFDLSANKAGAVIAGTEKVSKIKMASVNNKVFAAAGSKLLIIDGETAGMIKETDMGAIIYGISKTAKENIQIITANNNNVSLITINGKDHSTLETKTIEGMTIPNFMTSAFCSDAKNEGNAYILSAQGWSVNQIMKFANNSAYAIFTIPSTDFPNTGMFYVSISVNPETGNIYFGYVKGWGKDYLNNGVGIISADGKKVADYGSLSTDAKTRIDTRFCAGIYFTNPYSNK